MKKYNIITLIAIFSLFSLWTTNIALAQTTANTAEVTDEISVELISDDITAESLGISEDIKTPGENGYWWNRVKNNTRSFFTFDKAKKTELKLKLANMDLLSAKKLADNDNTPQATANLAKALENYKKHINDAEERLKNVPEDKKQAILKKIDEQQLKHQQLFDQLIEKTSAGAKDKLVEAKQERIHDWYENNKDNIKERLEQTINDDEIGSKFKQLKNMATLEELKAELPSEAQVGIANAIEVAKNRLNEKLKNASQADQEKLEKYIQQIPLDAVKKASLINNLDDALAPINIQERLQKIKAEHLDDIKERFNGLSAEQKEEFLKDNFEDNTDASKLEILEKLKSNAEAGDRAKLQNVNEQQQQLLKKEIQHAQDGEELKMLEYKMRNVNAPILQKEIQDRKIEIEQGTPQARPLYDAGL